MKKLLNLVIVAVLVLGIFSCTTMATATGNTKYFHDNNPGTYSTGLNAVNSFISVYYTDAYPTMEYRYRYLSCLDKNATLGVTLHANIIKWYNILCPSEYEVGTTVTTEGAGANDTSGYWYGWTYRNVECSGTREIMERFSIELDSSSSVYYSYDINTNGTNYFCAKGDWQVICSYGS